MASCGLCALAFVLSVLRWSAWVCKRDAGRLYANQRYINSTLSAAVPNRVPDVLHCCSDRTTNLTTDWTLLRSELHRVCFAGPPETRLLHCSWLCSLPTFAIRSPDQLKWTRQTRSLTILSRTPARISNRSYLIFVFQHFPNKMHNLCRVRV